MAIHIAPRPVKAGPLGPGAGPLLTEPHLGTILGQSPQKRMRKAWQLGISVPWIRAAERVVSDACASVDWHLEDELDEEVTDESKDQDALAVRALIEKPQAQAGIGKKLTRRDLWALTFRHMGLCGNSFWYMDARNGLGIPSSILYIRPDRMTPGEDTNGNLTHWQLDARDRIPNSGTRIELEEVIQFMLQPPDEGHFGVGLVESALLKADIAQGVDRHALSVLAAGGRIAGLLAPKQGSFDDTQFRQVVNDARTIVEQPDAAKRLQVLRAPVDFTSTAMTMDEAKIVDMMVRARDDLLALWGVPPTQLGIQSPAGLNSGERGGYEEAAFWQNANHPRIVTFQESVQYQLLDAITVVRLEFELTEPEFDDEAPRYEIAAKAKDQPLTNKERREILGFEPFGDARDYEVWLPINVQLAFPAPDETGKVATIIEAPVVTVPERPALLAGETSLGKASLTTGLTKIRAAVDRAVTPKLKSAVAGVLADQRRDVAAWLRSHAAHVEANPKDRVWWNEAQENRRMRSALAAPIIVMAQQTNEHIAQTLMPQKALLSASERALTRGATRVTAINDRTRDAIARYVSEGITQGLSPAQVADTLEQVTLDNGIPAFDELRAETIARTELTAAYNGAALDSYGDAGITRVQAIDGDQDEECADRNGREFTLADADGISDHPNGTLDWLPIL